MKEFLAFSWAVDEVVVLRGCTMLVSAGSNNTLIGYDSGEGTIVKIEHCS